ncbi:MAG: efflux transporter periplasmic adaptor subunit [Rhodobacterales bacterium]|nr:MAG: efflux transporter periplasmic adaptor subunit [Rhodobacterales bacterium]
MRNVLLAAALGALLPLTAPLAAPLAVIADTGFTVTPVTITEWKAVFGKIEARNTVPSRARIGGTLVEITVEEGSTVAMGQVIGRIADAKLDLQLTSVDAQIDALVSQLENAQAELQRGEDLLKRGVTTAQRLDALRTQVSVLENRIDATRAERRVIEERAAEGAVIAPIAGRVLSVPVTAGSVLMPGERVATIGGGGFFLRLAIPERHAALLEEGAPIQIGHSHQTREGRLAKVYPQIENGRVVADVELDMLDNSFVDARVPVRLPVGKSTALLVPTNMITTRMGLDFVMIEERGHPALRSVVPGETHIINGVEMVEILTGLATGDAIIAPRDIPVTARKGDSHD